MWRAGMKLKENSTTANEIISSGATATFLRGGGRGARLLKLSFRFEIFERLDDVLQARDVLAQYQPVPKRPPVVQRPRFFGHYVPGHVLFRRVVYVVDGHRHFAQDLNKNFKKKITNR